MLQKPGDENDWDKLEQLRQIVRDECEGRQRVVLSDDGLANKVASAILADPILGSEARLGADVVDLNNASVVLLRRGVRLELKHPHCEAAAKAEQYAKAAAAEIQAERALWVFVRPVGTELAMPLRKKDLAIFKDKKTLKARAARSQETQADILDHLLEILWAAVFFSWGIYWSSIRLATGERMC